MHGTVHILRRTPVATVYDFTCAACPECTSDTEKQHGYEVALVRRGRFTLESRRRQFDVDSRMMVLSNEGDEYAFRHDHHVTDECTVIRVSHSLLSDVRDRSWRKGFPASAAPDRQLLPLPVLPSSPHVDYLHSQLRMESRCDVQRGTLGFESVVIALVSEMYAGMFDGSAYPSGKPREEHMVAIERAKEFAIAHLHEDLSLADLAAEANLSVYHFARLFKNITTLSPYRFLTQIRLFHAARLLRDSSRSVTDISLDAGFNSLSHFTDSFCRFFGSSPTTYRRN